MSASKKDELLKNLTRRDAQKPPMEVTYENKGIVLDQMMDRNSPPPKANDINSDVDINDDRNVDINKEIIVNSNKDNDVKNDINIDVDSNDDIDVDIDVEDEVAVAQETDAIDALLSVNKKQSQSKSFKGFYLDPDVARVLEKLAKKHGKGIQSQLVNEALRMVFVAKGLM